MINSMVKKKKIIIILSIVFITIMCGIVYLLLHPTHYKYCDMWIIGKTLEQVEGVYGEFDYIEKTRAGYFTHMEGGTRCYYWMNYENGVIYKVNMGCERGG